VLLAAAFGTAKAGIYIYIDAAIATEADRDSVARTAPKEPAPGPRLAGA
jgi:hypothetical protein